MGGDNLPDLSNPNLEIELLCVTVPTHGGGVSTNIDRGPFNWCRREAAIHRLYPWTRRIGTDYQLRPLG